MRLRLPLHSLRISILAQLAFLIVAAMLLISVVMISFQEHAFIQGKLRQGRLLALTLSLQFKEMRNAAAKSRMGHPAGSPDKNGLSLLMRTSGFTGASLMDHTGTVIFTSGPGGRLRQKGIAQARQTLVTRKSTTRFSGQTWGVLWLASDAVIMSAPVLDGRHLLGSVAVWSSLRNVYQEIRRSEKLILIYILLNTLVLISVGLYLLSRSVVNPVHKLLHITEAFRKGESLPLPSFLRLKKMKWGSSTGRSR